jgi:hypothetical protein
MGTGIADEGGWIYNMSVFSITDLPHENHTLTISQGSNSFMVLDYLAYTHLSNSKQPSAVSMNTIIGAAVGGGVALLLAVVGLAVVWKRRSRKFYRQSIDLGNFSIMPVSYFA